MAKAFLRFAFNGRSVTLFLAAVAVVTIGGLALQFGLIEFSTTARAVCASPGEATVVTDKEDYAPSETVVIEGCSLEAWEGQTLTLTVTRPDGSVDSTTVTVSAGKFTYNYLLDGILGIYYVNVLDAGSNVIAATTFTDHTSAIVLVRDNDDAFFANSYTTDTFGVTMDISWTGLPDVTQARFKNDPTPEDACPAFVAEAWVPITEIGVTNTATFPWTVTGDTVSGLRKVCSQTAYGTLGTPEGTINSEDVIFFRRPNPVLAQTCGLDVVVVLDNSGSIDAGELASEKALVNGIVTALMPETPTEMALVVFNTSAAVAQAFTASEATMTGAVNAVAASGNFTNWDDAIADGRVLLPHRAGNADLIIVVSDGHPNRRGGHTLLTHTAGVSGAVTETAAMAWAIAEANQAKLDGARIIGLGEGGDLSVNNMIGISGTSVHPPAAVSTSTDVFTADFASLASTLATFAGENCPAKINVHKTIDADGNLGTTGDQTPGVGWTFTCSAAPDSCTPGSGATDGSGNISFDVSMGGDSTATASITETLQAGFGFVSASCTRNSISIGTPGSGMMTGIGPLAPADTVDCTFYNTPAAYLTVNKVCLPPADPGLFNLRIDGITHGANKPCGGTTGPVLLSAGPHTVSETAGTGTNLADYFVTIGGDCAGNGGITLAAGENKTCTITNERAGTVVIRKVAVPQGSQAFSFNCTTFGGFQLDDDGAEGNPLNSSATFTSVLPGNYDCAESQVSGWMIQIACTDPDNGTTIESPVAHIDVDGGETVECTFTNTFVPGQTQAVGGIMGLIEGPDGAPPAGGAAGDRDWPGRNTAVALLALAFAAFVASVSAVRRRV